METKASRAEGKGSFSGTMWQARQLGSVNAVNHQQLACMYAWVIEGNSAVWLLWPPIDWIGGIVAITTKVYVVCFESFIRAKKHKGDQESLH